MRFTNSTFFSNGIFLTNGINFSNGGASASWDGDNFDNLEVELLTGINNMSSPYWENPNFDIPAGHFFLVTGSNGGVLFNPFFNAVSGWAGAAPNYMASISGSWAADGTQASGSSPCTAIYTVSSGTRFTLTGVRNGCTPFVAANGASVATLLSETGNDLAITGASPQINMASIPDASGNETISAIALQNGIGTTVPFLGLRTLKAASGIADGDGLIFTSNGSFDSNHIFFHNGNAPFSAAETEFVQPSFFDGDVGFNSGINNDFLGFKHVRVTSTCTTAATLGSTCTFTVALPGNAFVNTSFTSTCTGVGTTSGVPILTVHAVTVSQLTLQIQAGSAAAATIGGADCVAVHD
jgi:hypothetical protein